MPPWIRSSFALQPRAKRRSKHVRSEEEEEAFLEEQERRSDLGVHPWVHPLLKLALSKQGLEQQGIPAVPEEWDTPDVVEMLTRVRPSELRRPQSAKAGGAVMESGEMYRFGASAEVDAILRQANGGGAEGRCVSVPLVERGTWLSKEAPQSVGGILIATRKSHAEGRGGGHLPPSMYRLGIVPRDVLPPRLIASGETGVTHVPGHPPTPSPRMAIPQFAGGPPPGGQAASEVIAGGGGTPLYPGRLMPKADLPDLSQVGGRSEGRQLDALRGSISRPMKKRVSHQHGVPTVNRLLSGESVTLLLDTPPPTRPSSSTKESSFVVAAL